jgi:hypothetical protein
MDAMENRRRVLVAQSDTKAAFELRSFLLEQGWDVLIANDALQAFSIAIREKPAVVVVSGELAGGGGLSLLDRMRNSVHTARIQIIGTGKGDKWKQEFLSAGAMGFIDRPITTGSLPFILRPQNLHPRRVVETPVKPITDFEESGGGHDGGAAGAPEPAFFNELAELAAELLKAPGALLSVIAKDRQFLTSQIGLAGNWADPRQTPLLYSFCQWVVCGRDESVVPDARRSEGILPSLGFRDLGIIAYAGVPIGSRAETIGALCAVDFNPHPWSESDLDTLRDLSKIAENYVALKNVPRRAAGAKITKGSRQQDSALRYIDAAESSATRIVERRDGTIEAAERDLLTGILRRFSEHHARTAAAHS